MPELEVELEEREMQGVQLNQGMAQRQYELLVSGSQMVGVQLGEQEQEPGEQLGGSEIDAEETSL